MQAFQTDKQHKFSKDLIDVSFHKRNKSIKKSNKKVKWVFPRVKLNVAKKI